MSTIRSFHVLCSRLDRLLRNWLQNRLARTKGSVQANQGVRSNHCSRSVGLGPMVRALLRPHRRCHLLALVANLIARR
jgi:hypothetical protein